MCMSMNMHMCVYMYKCVYVYVRIRVTPPSSSSSSSSASFMCVRRAIFMEVDLLAFEFMEVLGDSMVHHGYLWK